MWFGFWVEERNFEVKAIPSEKNKEIEVLKSLVTLLQNHVSKVKHAVDKKVDELEL